jgi:alpha-beta hydrolase superfamily lysophospholipase
MPPARLTRSAAAAVAVGAGVTYARQRVLALQEWRAARAAASPADVGVEPTTITLTSTAGTQLHGWWAPASAEDAPTVIGVHGFASHAGDLVELLPILHAAGIHVLLLDLRGHGRSEATTDRPRPPRLAEDVIVAVDWLTARDDVTQIGLVGHSMGGSTAIVAASRDDRIRAVVSVAGVADPTLTRIGWWPAWISRGMLTTIARRTGTDPTSSFARARIALLEVPVLLIHGDADRIVPLAHSEALKASQPAAELVIVGGVGHASFADFTPAMERATQFLLDALQPPSDAPPRARSGTNSDQT